MNNQSFSMTILVDQSPAEVFHNIQNVRGWWSGIYSESITGESNVIDDEFSFHAGGGAHYSKQKLVELIPDEKIVWLVTDSTLTFLNDTGEWTNTKFGFDISRTGDKTKVVFTHDGLTPQIECYNICSGGWTQYLEKLKSNLK
jgi:Activator of Hsp90 ATPase homolog 1-like protein